MIEDLLVLQSENEDEDEDEDKDEDGSTDSKEAETESGFPQKESLSWKKLDQGLQ